MRTTCIWGLDPGQHLGWAACAIEPQPQGRIYNWHSGVYDVQRGGIVRLDKREFASQGVKLHFLRHFLSDLDHEYGQPTAVFFEEVRQHRGSSAAHWYGHITGVISEWCDDHGVSYLSVPVGTWKRLATGKGNASKEQVLAAAERRWPGQKFKQDEADARYIAACGLEQWRINSGN